MTFDDYTLLLLSFIYSSFTLIEQGNRLLDFIKTSKYVSNYLDIYEIEVFYLVLNLSSSSSTSRVNWSSSLDGVSSGVPTGLVGSDDALTGC